MNYRILGRTGIKVSEIGLGGEGLENIAYEKCKAIIDYAIEKGINLIDLFNSNPTTRTNVGRALKEYPRDAFVIEGHIGSAWDGEQYFRTRDMSAVKGAYEDFFTRTNVEYVDIGMIHYVDDVADFENVCKNGILDYAKDQLKAGRIKCIGISTHNPDIAHKAVENGSFDVILFSINAAYDTLPPSDDIDVMFAKETYNDEYQGINPVREELYQRCEQEGVALTVMKGFAGGALLDESESPFYEAMTPVQCIAYAMDRPGVASFIGGFSELQQIEEALEYLTASVEQLDYDTILKAAPGKSLGRKCTYFGHCAPCPNRIDVALVNKYLDLAQTQTTVPDTVRDHYNLLDHHAGECIECSSCMKNCPFDVDVITKMKDAVKIFGK